MDTSYLHVNSVTTKIIGKQARLSIQILWKQLIDKKFFKGCGGVFLNLQRYREIFSMAVVLQLQIWHFQWPASVKFVGDLPSHVLFF